VRFGCLVSTISDRWNLKEMDFDFLFADHDALGDRFYNLPLFLVG
jgi:hypothetical protein